jgi:hypothetical protein
VAFFDVGAVALEVGDGGACGLPNGTAESGRPLWSWRVHISLVPVVITVMIVIVVVVMAPLPICPLLIAFKSAIVATIGMILDNPLVIVNSFVIVPAMILVTIRVIDTIASGCTIRGQGRREKGHTQ